MYSKDKRIFLAIDKTVFIRTTDDHENEITLSRAEVKWIASELKKIEKMEKERETLEKTEQKTR